MVLSEIITVMIYAISIVFLPEYFGEFVSYDFLYLILTREQISRSSPRSVLRGRSLSSWQLVRFLYTSINLFAVKFLLQLPLNYYDSVSGGFCNL